MHKQTRQALNRVLVFLRETMRVISQQLLTPNPIARLRCGRCHRVFNAEKEFADSLIHRLLFFSGVHLGDRIPTNCPGCGRTSAVLVDAGYTFARA
jgi:ribosomal protein S27AE